METIIFCDEFEQFIDVLQDYWWNYGDYGQLLKTCQFMRQRRILDRLDMIKPIIWLDNIFDMLNAIPSITFHQADKFYDSLDSQLTAYERLRNAATLLELALWKSTLSDKFHPMKTDSAIRLECRDN